ncbi:carboxypeptidase-like regulatory domain-containing protein [Myroides fluvii]|uniref:carboxypeptidase-like regulatory domain-containing protein n=1 Tax=Myroides fluvii TaxID=2572594 RepID=UPI00131C1770|nr:carboxypeptidase-like regulatory domain-containing protein [Myroides fluvii]
MRNVLLYCFVLLCSLHVLAGPRKIKGVVLAKGDGLPLPGAAVLEKGTENGVGSNVNGVFELKLQNKKSDSIVFAYIGFHTQEIKLEKEKDFYTITLEEDLGDVEEVIIIHNLDSPIRKRRAGCTN